MSKHSLTIEFPSRAALMAYMLATVSIDTTGAASQANDDAGDEAGPADPNAPAVDSTGLPWDERIHSSNKKQTEKGVWRKARNVSDILFSQVEAELRARVAQQPAAMPMQQPIQTMPMQQMQTPPAAMPMQQPVQTMPMQQPVQTMPQTMPVQQMQQTPAMGMQSETIDFPVFMAKLSQAMQTNNPATGMPYVDSNYLSQICSWQQIADIGQIASDPGKLQAVVAQFKQDNRWPA